MKTVYWVAIAFLVSSLVFFAFKAFSPVRTYFLEGMKIESDTEPSEGLGRILSQSPQIVRMEMYNGSDSRNSIVIAMAAEAISSIAYGNGTVASYAYVLDPNDTAKPPGFLGCNQNNSDCGKPTITVRYGGCNCLRVKSGQNLLEIEGNEGFAGENLLKVRGIIGLILQSIKDKKAPTQNYNLTWTAPGLSNSSPEI